MPTYQYVCTDCGAPLEVVQSFTDDALTECPTCGGRLRKVFSPVGVVFKGSGFYRTDSRGKAGGADSAAKPKDGAKDGSDTGASGTKEKSGSTASSGTPSSGDSSSSSSGSSSKTSTSSSSGSKGSSGGSSAA